MSVLLIPTSCLFFAYVGSTSNTRAFPWLLLAHASRSLAFAHHGLASGVSGAEDPKALESAAKAMSEGAACAKAYRGLLSSCPRHACATGSGEGGGKVHQVSEGVVRTLFMQMYDSCSRLAHYHCRVAREIMPATRNDSAVGGSQGALTIPGYSRSLGALMCASVGRSVDISVMCKLSSEPTFPFVCDPG